MHYQNTKVCTNTETLAYELHQKRENKIGQQVTSQNQVHVPGTLVLAFTGSRCRQKLQQLSLRLWVWKDNDTKLPRLSRDKQT